MRYEVYADRLFLLHFGMNFLLLVLTARLGEYRTGWRHLAVSAMLGSVVFLAVLLTPMGTKGPAVAGKVLILAVGSLWMLYVAFAGKGKNRRPAAKEGQAGAVENGKDAVKQAVVVVMEAAVLYMASACLLGGALLAAGGIGQGRPDGNAGPGGSLRILAPAACAAVGGLWLSVHMKRRRKNPFWEVELLEGDRRMRLTALMDSGNSLYDPVSGKPVCIVERAVMGRLSLLEKAEGFYLIPYHSVGKEHGLLQAAVVEEMYLQKGGQRVKREKVLLAASDRALSKAGRYQMLLHPALLEETKGAKHDIESSNAGKDAV